MSRAALLQFLVGAAIIGTNAMMVRIAHTAPTVTAFWRMAFSALFLAALVQWRHGWVRLSPKACMWVSVPAVAFACDLWMWHRSIGLIGPGLATLLGNLQVFVLAVAGVVLFGERLSLRFLAGALVGFAGLWLLLGAGWAALPDGVHLGVWYGLGTALSYGFYSVGLRRAQEEATRPHTRVPVEQLLCLAAAGSAVLLGIAGMVEGASFAIPDIHTGVVLVVMAAVGHCLAWVLISRGLAVLPAALAGLLLLLQPLVAYLLDVVLLHQPTTPRQWAGLCVTLLGVFIAGMKPSRKPPQEGH